MYRTKEELYKIINIYNLMFIAIGLAYMSGLTLLINNPNTYFLIVILQIVLPLTLIIIGILIGVFNRIELQQLKLKSPSVRGGPH